MRDLASFLSALRHAGLPVGYLEEARAHQVFAQWPEGDEVPAATLRSLLRAVVVKQTAHDEPFERVFDHWIRDADDEVQAREKAKQVGKTGGRDTPSTRDRVPEREQVRQRSVSKRDPEPRRRWKFIAAGVALVAATTIVIAIATSGGPKIPEKPPEPDPPPPVTPITQDTEKPLTVAELRTRKEMMVVPAIAVSPPVPYFDAWLPLGLGLLSLATTAGLWWFASRRKWLPDPEPLPPRRGPPRVFLTPDPVGLVLLDHLQQQSLVWSIGQFISELPTRKLAVRETVRATAAAGGIPTPVFQVARFQRELWVWLDEAATDRDPSLGRLADEIAHLLPIHGLTVERATFWGIPSSLFTGDRRRFAPREIEDRRDGAIVLVLTDGRMLLQAREGAEGRLQTDALLRGLSHWPSLFFVDPSEGRTGLADLLGSYGISCVHPSALAARVAGATRSARKPSSGPSASHAWAAALALSPSPVDEETAWRMQRHLRKAQGVFATPWDLRAIRDDAQSIGNRLTWSWARRAELLDWLSTCEVAVEGAARETLFQSVLHFWKVRYRREAEDRLRSDPGAWPDSPAERHLRMEQALLGLWDTPSSAIPALYRLYGGDTRAVIEDHLKHHDGRESADEAKVRLPWRFDARTGPEQQMLATMRFGGRDESSVKTRKPGRLWLGLGLGVGAGMASLGIAVMRPMAVDSGAPDVRLADGTPPSGLVTNVRQTPDNRYEVSAAAPHHAVSATVPAGGKAQVTWAAREQPCVVSEAGVEVWRCGRSVTTDASDKNPLRLVVLVGAAGQAAPLAARLLDTGSAATVLIAQDWARADDWVQRFSPASLGEARGVLVVSARSDLTLGPDMAGVAVVAAPEVSWPSFAKALDFTGTKAVSEVWPQVTRIAGDPSRITLRGATGCPTEYTDADGTAYVRVCGGTFTMGAPESEAGSRIGERPQHRVTLSPFEIGKTEVTNAAYRRVMGDHYPEAGPDLPAVNVKWDQAKTYCEKTGGRLPTEAEWEYAARAGTTTRWSFGDDEGKLKDYAWYRDNSYLKIHPVGKKLPNPWGLYDMHGNAWEWTSDWYGPYSEGAVSDPQGAASGDRRVLRGGSFNFPAEFLRSANRDWGGPESWVRLVGFRCVRGPRRQP